ncbi:MAG: glycosyltransferase [Verrucomicrobia bacterium]|nr:glycosyltransferase [Verrucomicrobiota bacterium]
MITLSVILCTRNPDAGRLNRTLAGLAAQSLGADHWELLIVDNGSSPSLSEKSTPLASPNQRIIQEKIPGLTPARLRGIAEARGEILVFVDDDNVLAPAFLSHALAAFQTHPRLAAAGGPVRPEFEITPPGWAAEFYPLLALHDHGHTALFATGGHAAPWPDFAPAGAGLCLRRDYATLYAAAVRSDPARAALDRRAGALTSGGDNDMVFTALHAGGDVAYFPGLELTHLIPAKRLDPAYLARLNRGIQRSWMQVLSLHRANPWPPLTTLGARLRILKAWFRHFPLFRSSPAHRIRWHGSVGHFEGRVRP